MRKALKYLPLLLLPLLASGCSLFSGNVATLWTNEPEFAAYVELFNTSQSRYKIEIAYRALPAQSILDSAATPDLVIGDRLSSVNVITKFAGLGTVLGNGGIEAGRFYKELLATGRYQGKQLLLPISFDLPVILSENSGSATKDKQSLLTPTEILAASKAFDKKSTNSFKVMGFSPLWSPDFLYSTAQLLGSDFHQTTSGNLAWDEAGLKKTIDEMRSWIKKTDGGAEAEKIFREKYLYDPVAKLLHSGRILYDYSTLKAYFELPQAERKAIAFHWLGDGSHIPVTENVLYVGVPARARNKGAAHAFLRWFFQPQTQSQLLEVTRYERIKTFGIGGGLSSLSVVNERDFPQYYSVLLGRIPGAAELSFPRSLPSDWGELKANVIIPWMRSEVIDQASGPQLQVRLKAWRLQKPLP